MVKKYISDELVSNLWKFFKLQALGCDKWITSQEDDLPIVKYLSSIGLDYFPSWPRSVVEIMSYITMKEVRLASSFQVSAGFQEIVDFQNAMVKLGSR